MRVLIIALILTLAGCDGIAGEGAMSCRDDVQSTDLTLQETQSANGSRRTLREGDEWAALYASPAGEHRYIGVFTVADSETAPGFRVRYIQSSTSGLRLVRSIGEPNMAFENAWDETMKWGRLCSVM